MIAYSLDGVSMVRAIILSLLGIHLGNAAMPSDESPQVQGVVNSPVTLRCGIPPEFDTETVRWFVNYSSLPFLTYLPKEDITSPLDHSPRFSITDPEELNISPLLKLDTGVYKCRHTSSLSLNDVVHTINVTIKDGCTMLPYIQPLATTSNGCLPGEVLTYAQQCAFTCMDGFHLVGNASTECQGNGELTTQIPHCEDITCLIGDLPPHLNDINGICVKDAQVLYGETCYFECTTGYRLNGNGTTQIICGSEDVPHFPECEEESRQLNGGYIALICVVILCILIASAVLLLKLHKTNKEKAWCLKQERIQAVPLQNTGKTEENWENDNESTPLMITTYGGFMDYLRRQIGESYAAINMILQKLEESELKNIPKLSRMLFNENQAPDTCSITGAFVWYVAEIVRCIDLSSPKVGGDLITDILSSTEDITSKGSKKTASVVSLEREKGEGTKTYFDVVHLAFENLLVVLQKNINAQEVVKKTTNVSNMMKSYFKKKKQEIKDTALQTNESITADWAKSSDGANFFAKICLRNIGKCENFDERIRMRCNIIRLMIDNIPEEKH